MSELEKPSSWRGLESIFKGKVVSRHPLREGSRRTNIAGAQAEATTTLTITGLIKVHNS
jgi:hypothetical protein